MWAIGTGVVATPLQAQDTQYQVRKSAAEDGGVICMIFCYLTCVVSYILLNDCIGLKIDFVVLVWFPDDSTYQWFSVVL